MVASRAWKTSHNCIRGMPTDIDYAKRLGNKNTNNFWIKEIEKHIHTVGITFQTWDEKSPVLVEYKKGTGEMIFI